MNISVGQQLETGAEQNAPVAVHFNDVANPFSFDPVNYKADSRLVQSKAVSHWLGASLESALNDLKYYPLLTRFTQINCCMVAHTRF